MDRSRRLGMAVLLFAAFLAPVFVVIALSSGRAAGRALVAEGGPTPAQTEAKSQGRGPLAQAGGEGQLLYEERCATCHGEDGAGTDLGPSIRGLGAAAYDFQLSTGRMPLAQPRAQAIRKPPAFTTVQIDALVAYLASLAPGGLPIPIVDAAAGNLSLGQRTYQLNCAACHGSTGNGGAVGSEVAPNLHVATETQIGEAVRTGPGTMPVFDQGTISDAALDSLARFVLYLRHPQDEGGAGLSHAGPIIEGFVALLAGLGTILLVTRFIGARS